MTPVYCPNRRASPAVKAPQPPVLKLMAFKLPTPMRSQRNLSPGSDVLDQIRETFGEQALTPAGEYNRPDAELVFGQPDQLQVLNSIVHPAVRAQTQIALTKPKTQPYQIWMIPLLVETALMIKRLRGRGGCES